MQFKSVFVLVAAAALPALLVNGQQLTECITNCITPAATAAGCSSIADLGCVCTSQAFQSQAAACLQANCTAEEVTTAEQLQQTNCAAVTFASSAISSLSSAASSAISSLSEGASSFESSLSSRTSAIGSSLSSLTGTGTATSATGTESNAAAGFKVPFGPGVVLSAAVGALGVAVGALIV